MVNEKFSSLLDQKKKKRKQRNIDNNIAKDAVLVAHKNTTYKIMAEFRHSQFENANFCSITNIP